MTNSQSQNPLTSRQAQETFARLATAALRQIDVAASAKHSPRDRARALRKLDRALAALADPPK